jgi:hypothetical protein
MVIERSPSVFIEKFYNLNVNIVMYLGETEQLSRHVRTSKLGKQHPYTRKLKVVNLRCDCCGSEFQRERGKMDPNRLNNNFFHVCSNCDAKKFAQKRGVEKRKMWNLTASSSRPISSL